MSINTYEKEIINEMIFKACLSKYKKDNPKAFKIIEKKGYTTKKLDGRIIIHNPKTGKNVSVNQEYIWNQKKRIYEYIPYIAYDTGKRHTYYKYDKGKEITKFDFVNYLEKPINKEFYRNIPKSKYKNAREEIKWQKKCKEYTENDIEQIKKVIMQNIQLLEDKTQKLQKIKDEIEQIRKEIKT